MFLFSGVACFSTDVAADSPPPRGTQHLCAHLRVFLCSDLTQWYRRVLLAHSVSAVICCHAHGLLSHFLTRHPSPAPVPSRKRSRHLACHQRRSKRCAGVRILHRRARRQAADRAGAVCPRLAAGSSKGAAAAQGTQARANELSSSTHLFTSKRSVCLYSRRWGLVCGVFWGVTCVLSFDSELHWRGSCACCCLP